MKKFTFFSSLVFFQALASSAIGEEECSSTLRSPLPIHAGVRHVEGKGIGYNQGYTTLELFLSPDVERFTTLPFLELRGHIFDNGQFAFNTGVGFRYRGSRRSYGANLFYDYRETSHRNFGQISLGLESLGTVWDFRMNGYLPIGTTDSHWFSPKFSKFEAHHLFIRRKQEFAMKGLDAEVGLHFLPKVKTWDLYTAAGPYYFEGKGENTYGGKLRVGTLWKNFISLEASGSYDNIFHGIVQGQIGFRVPFGAQSAIKSKNKCASSRTRKLMDRMVQPVVRDEIIVTNTRHRDFLARNSETGEPLFFWFVNNLSHSAGTFESPFPALTDALSRSKPGDIIYIYPGDGTTTGLDAGLTTFQLQDNQQLWGTGIPYIIRTQFGRIRIPVLAGGLPHLTASAGVSAINVANNNTISALNIAIEAASSANYCIGAPSGTAIANLTVINNVLTATGSGRNVAGGIFSNTFSGSLVVANNQITTTGSSGGSRSEAINITNTDNTAIYNITNNRLTAALSTAVFLTSTSTTPGTAYATSQISFNTIEGTTGLNFALSGQLLYTHIVQNNTFTNCSTGITDSISQPANGRFILTSNVFENNSTAVNMTATSSCLRFLNNTSDSGGYTLNYGLGGPPFRVEPFVGNTPTPTLGGGITLVPANYCGN